MYKLYYSVLSLFLLCSDAPLFGAAVADTLSDLPEVAQDADVHTLSRTYCKVLWSRVQADGYLSAPAPEFKDAFTKSVLELGIVIEKIKNAEPIMIGSQINLSDKPVTDPAMLSLCSYFDSDAYSPLKTALTSMSVLGQHKGGADLDGETNAHVNEVFVYVWHKVKEDTERLQGFLIGLLDASPTCIQGYTVRMLCAVHPPKLKAAK
ncbi:MAG: hypothetical protein I8H80_01110 [Alphaproteobacteria bacterium]|nr:hypothetical protein [Alphaproteobacteria bacterium]